MDFTTNDECGVLVDGYDLLPTILTNWHHPLLPGADRGRRADQGDGSYMWALDVADRGSGPPGDLAGRRRGRGQVRDHRAQRCARRTWRPRSARFLEVYNAAWERNWGFVPLTEEEVRHYAKDLKPILDENWAFVAEKDGEPVGAALTLPDYNQVLIHLNGRLLPFGWAKFLWYRRKIDRVRVFALGVKPRVAAHGHRGQVLRAALRRGERTPQSARRDGLDAREQQVDEPRDGGDGRQDRPHLPGLREVL